MIDILTENLHWYFINNWIRESEFLPYL
jgi:hypothetical protein